LVVLVVESALLCNAAPIVLWWCPVVAVVEADATTEEEEGLDTAPCGGAES
jgi:hypothetical protein